MAKRSARNTKVVHTNDAKVTSLFDGGWTPLGHGGAVGEDREQSYRRTVRPQSDNQRALIDAMVKVIDPLNGALAPAESVATAVTVWLPRPRPLISRATDHPVLANAGLAK